MTEAWRPIPSAPGYEVSDLGRVRSVARVITDSRGHRRGLPGRVLRQRTAKQSGHKTVCLPPKTNVYVHRLVLEAFDRPALDGELGLHGRGGPGDNRPGNLRWGTHADNAADAVEHREAELREVIAELRHRLSLCTCGAYAVSLDC